MALDVPVVGLWNGDAETLVAKVPQENQSVARELAVFYLKYAKKFNLRADLLWAQMLLETNGLRFTGEVKGNQYNYAGLKTETGDGFASFDSPELGVVGHIAHLSWYAYPEHFNELCNMWYDPRHQYYHRNTVKLVKDLGGGNWTPNKSYAKNIVRVWNEGL